MQIGINFEYPWALALFPVLAAFILITGRALKTGSPVKNRVIHIIRLLLLLILLLAVSSPTVSFKPEKTATIFIADVSDSVKDKTGDMESFIKAAVEEASEKDISGVVAFGKNADIIQMPEDGLFFSTLKIRTKSDGTNIEKALIMARSIMPPDHLKRLVLLTDGRETEGNALETARLLARLGYTLDVVPFVTEEKPEVQLDEFTAPGQVNAGERFDVILKVKSNVNTKATIRLFGNRTLTAEKQVDLYKGDNLFTFNDMIDQSGVITYTAEVTADNDTVFQNNQLSAFTLISDRPHVLLVEKDNSGENFARYIGDFAQITRVQPEEVPSSLQGIMSYDAFVLSDISAEWLDDGFLNLLEQAVQNHGKGLLTIGGENSYAPGGYRNTPLERILPVNVDIRSKEEIPDLGLVLVIDKSGSMSGGQYGITKLELAKEAAIRAAEVLEEKDQLGVIAFDDAIQWVIKTEPLTNKEKAVELIGSIRPGGGTQILHPLEEAWQNLRTKDTKLKHIILLTDGQAEKHGYETIIEGLDRDGITLSTVAVGEGADTLLLKALAYGGNGRYYQTDEFTDIPSIFVKEAFLAGQKYLQNRSFYPELVSSTEILKGIDVVPQLDGYVATTAKATARTIFRSDINDPVLAVWQYGLGRTAAWTSDIRGLWTSKWAAWHDAPVFWGNLTGWLIQKNLNAGYNIEAFIQDGKGVISLSTELENMLYEEAVKGVLVAPDGTGEEIRLDAVRPGLFEGIIEKDQPGAYIVNIEVPGDGGTENISAGVTMPYSQEYRILDESGHNFLQKLAQAGLVRVIAEPGEVYKGEVQNTGGKRELTNLLITLSIILLLIDIAVKRLRIPLEPVIAFLNEKLALPVRGLIKKYKKEKSIKAVTDEKSRSEEISGTISRAEEKSGAKEVKLTEKKKVSHKSYDHVNALLNRRKKWK
ncbi:MAG: VWA domain-containing protein [Clostridiaceae bacterium]|nr:VWA domain-containing protein [Clostridiaceae bacterium]